jgi:predicted NAD/FAD-dependent oxidoreductase
MGQLALSVSSVHSANDGQVSLPDGAPRAVVVGGGIGGLTAAVGLRLAGWDVTVLEQAERIEPVGAADGERRPARAVRALAGACGSATTDASDAAHTGRGHHADDTALGLVDAATPAAMKGQAIQPSRRVRAQQRPQADSRCRQPACDAQVSWQVGA